MAATTPTRTSLIHDFIVKSEADLVQFPAFVTSLTTNVPFTGAFAGLEEYRKEAVSAYNLFLQVKALLSQLKATPA